MLEAERRDPEPDRIHQQERRDTAPDDGGEPARRGAAGGEQPPDDAAGGAERCAGDALCLRRPWQSDQGRCPSGVDDREGCISGVVGRRVIRMEDRRSARRHRVLESRIDAPSNLGARSAREQWRGAWGGLQSHSCERYTRVWIAVRFSSTMTRPVTQLRRYGAASVTAALLAGVGRMGRRTASSWVAAGCRPAAGVAASRSADAAAAAVVLRPDARVVAVVLRLSAALALLLWLLGGLGEFAAHLALVGLELFDRLAQRCDLAGHAFDQVRDLGRCCGLRRSGGLRWSGGLNRSGRSRRGRRLSGSGLCRLRRRRFGCGLHRCRRRLIGRVLGLRQRRRGRDELRRPACEHIARRLAVGLHADRGGDAEAHHQHEAHKTATCPRPRRGRAQCAIVIRRRRTKRELRRRTQLKLRWRKRRCGRDTIGETDVQFRRIGRRRARYRRDSLRRIAAMSSCGSDCGSTCGVSVRSTGIGCIGAPAGWICAAGGRHRALTRARQYGGNDGAGELLHR